MPPTTVQVPARNEIKKIVKDASEWLSTKAGQDSLAEAVRKSVEFTDRLRESQRVDQKLLHEPITL